MLEIHEKTGIEGYEEIIDGIECDCLHIVESKNGDNADGYGIYSVDENGLTVYDYDSNDLNITDGIVRTILFKGMLGGINQCGFELKNKEKNKDLIRLGFITKKEKTITDINYFMNNCKKCKELR